MDFNVICRLCGENKKILTSIFIETDEDRTKNEILDQIYYLCSLEPFKGDSLPENICNFCKKKLRNACFFKEQIISIDEKLKNQSCIIKDELESDHDWDRLGEDADNKESFYEKEEYDDTKRKSGENADQENSDDEKNDETFIPENEQDESDNVEIYEKAKKTKTKKEKKSKKLIEKNEGEEYEIIADVDKDIFEDIFIKNALKRQTSNSSGKKRICPECGMLLASGNFSDHMLVKHGGEARFPCEICGKKLKTKRLVWAHKRAKHEEPNKINCDQCGMIFKTKSNFKKHYNAIHLDIRKHKCELCDKTFKFLKSYQSHVRSHTGERPYICNHCNKGFSGSWALKQHIRLHTNEKPYKCKYCEDAFTQNVTLKLHVKRKHIEPNEILPD